MGKSHANNSKKIMQQKHVSLYAFSHSLGEYDRPPKSIKTSKSLKKTLKGCKGKDFFFS